MKKMSKLCIMYCLGDSCTGKTSVINNLLGKDFSEKYSPTHCFNFLSWCPKVCGLTYNISIADSNYEEIGVLMQKFFLKNDNYKCFILMYDITNKNSLYKIHSVLDIIKKYNIEKKQNYPIIIVGNKEDLKEKRKISFEEGKSFANLYSLSFYETSAKTNRNVKELFNYLLKEYLGHFFFEGIYDKIYENNLDLFKINRCEKCFGFLSISINEINDSINIFCKYCLENKNLTVKEYQNSFLKVSCPINCSICNKIKKNV